MKRIADIFLFARGARHLEGELPLSACSRLEDLLSSKEGRISYRLEGECGDNNEAIVHVTLEGELQLLCQRCLQGLPFQLKVSEVLVLIDADSDLSQEELEDDERDFFPTSPEVDVAELIEDEIILSLPTVIRHENCHLPDLYVSANKLSPFAVLMGKPTTH